MRLNFNKGPSVGILTLFLALIAVLVGQSTAFPTPNSLKTETLDIIETSTQYLHNLGKRFTGQTSGKIGTTGPDKSDYPSDSEIEQACNPEAGKAFVFYSNADSNLAHQFAQQNNGLIVRQTFPKRYVGKKSPQGGGKRSDEWYQDHTPEKLPHQHPPAPGHKPIKFSHHRTDRPTADKPMGHRSDAQRAAGCN